MNDLEKELTKSNSRFFDDIDITVNKRLDSYRVIIPQGKIDFANFMVDGLDMDKLNALVLEAESNERNA